MAPFMVVGRHEEAGEEAPMYRTVADHQLRPASRSLRLDDERTREIRQRLAAGLGDSDCFADVDAEFRGPDSGNQMKCHVRLEDRRVSRPQADRVFPPIRRIV